MKTDPDGVPAADAAPTQRSRRRSPRRRILVLAGALGIPALVFVLWWFQPQALLFDDVVDESFPSDSAAERQEDDGADAEEPDDDGTDAEQQDDDSADTEPADEEGPDGTDSDRDGAQQDTLEEADAPIGGDTEDPELEEAPSGPVELAAGSFVSRNRYTVTGTATTHQLEDGQRILRLEDFESTNGPDLFVYLTVAGASDDDAALDADFVDLGVLTGNIGNQNYPIPPEVDLDRYTSVAIWCRRFTTSFGVADLSR